MAGRSSDIDSSLPEREERTLLWRDKSLEVPPREPLDEALREEALDVTSLDDAVLDDAVSNWLSSLARKPGWRLLAVLYEVSVEPLPMDEAR